MSYENSTNIFSKEIIQGSYIDYDNNKHEVKRFIIAIAIVEHQKIILGDNLTETIAVLIDIIQLNPLINPPKTTI